MTKNSKCHECKTANIDFKTQGRDSTMCKPCYEYAGWENTHTDENHEVTGADEECLVCQNEQPEAKPARKNMSHAECDHPSTKTARAKCRAAKK